MSAASKLRQLRNVCTDVRWWPFYLQRRFMSRTMRRSVAQALAKIRPAMPPENERNPAIESASEALSACGMAPLGRLLDEKACATLVDYFSACEVEDPYRPEAGRFLPNSEGRPSAAHVVYHRAEDVLSAPGLLDLANRPDILRIAGEFLSCKPTIAYMAAWWSFPTGLGAQQAENFHRDVDDWRFLKLFVYLTDVGPDNGPHVYVLGSSNSARLRKIQRFSDADVTAAMGPESLRTVTGIAGEGFLEDTFGIHKGQPVRAARRLMFQVVYSMVPLPYGPRTPVAALRSFAGTRSSDLDPWTNRLYLRR